MSHKILVTYASRTGTAAGIAEEVGKLLAESGAVVDVRSMSEVTDLAPYQSVVVGSAIQNRQWLPEAVQFVRENQAELKNKRCSMFSVCMTLAMKNGERYRPDVLNWVAPVRRIVQPVSEDVFAGKLEIHKIPSFSDRLKFRLSVLFGVWSEGDHRDWDAVRSWGRGLAAALVQG